MENLVLPKRALSADEKPQPFEGVKAPLWLAPPDETDLLRAVVNDYDAATRVLPTLDPRALTNDTARRLFGACRAVWGTGEPLRSETLAAYCQTQGEQCEARAQATANGSECEKLTAETGLWFECVELASNDLATPPAGAHDLAKEADGIAKRLSKAPQFDFLSLCEVLTRPDPSFLIDRLLTVGGTSLLTAKHASFKSFFALDMALCVASGRDFHGLKCERGGVIYIAAEGAAGLKKRAAAWLEHHGTPAPANFVILDRPFQIADAAQRAAFATATAALMPQLIVLDTLARCAVGLDENNAGDMGAFADALGRLARETGAHVLTVHHNNKNGDYRGSSALPAAVDTHLTLERHKETDAVTLATEKQKDAEELATLSFEKIEVALPNAGGLGHSLVFGLIETAAGSQWRLSQSEEKVLDELAGAFGLDGATATQWEAVCKDAGISRRAFYRAKRRLIELQAIEAPLENEKGGKFKPNSERCQTVPNGAIGT